MAYYYSATHNCTKDFYKILRIPHTASLEEIKSSYRKLALRLHPDLHKNNAAKTLEFKRVSEAYAVLSDESQKNAYDFSIGANRFNRSSRRTTAPPPNYRKVYTSQAPPPSWKGRTWNHDFHYDMHYGTGMREEAIRQAKETARKQEGAFEYRSPLGKGFTFSSSNNPHDNINPYSKHSVQGPPTITFEYEEGYQDAGNTSSDSSGKHFVRRRDRIVEDLHERRQERHLYEAEQRQRRQNQQQQTRYHSPFNYNNTAARGGGMMNGATTNNNNRNPKSRSGSPNSAFRRNTSTSARPGNDCVII